MSKYAFFLGCITPLRYPGIEAATRLVMKQFNIELVEMEGASCCPAPGVFGSFDIWNWLCIAARNLSIAEEKGVDITLVCNGCYGTLQEASYLLEDEGKRNEVNDTLSKINRRYTGQVKVKHIIEVLMEDVGFERIRSQISIPFKRLRVATHYGCHYLKPSKIRRHGSPENPRHLDDFVTALGAESVHYRDKLMCCGAGGGVRSAELDVALDFTLEKVQNMTEAGAECILTPCAFCHFQFDTGQVELKERGVLKEPIPVIFVTQLVGLALGIPPKKLGLYENRIHPKYLEKF